MRFYPCVEPLNHKFDVAGTSLIDYKFEPIIRTMIASVDISVPIKENIHSIMQATNTVVSLFLEDGASNLDALVSATMKVQADSRKLPICFVDLVRITLTYILDHLHQIKDRAKLHIKI